MNARSHERYIVYRVQYKLPFDQTCLKDHISNKVVDFLLSGLLFYFAFLNPYILLAHYFFLTPFLSFVDRIPWIFLIRERHLCSSLKTHQWCDLYICVFNIFLPFFSVFAFFILYSPFCPALIIQWKKLSKVASHPKKL